MPLPFLAPLLLKAKLLPWRWIAYAALLAAILGGYLWHRHSLISAGIATGEARITVLWEADTAARDKATAQSVAAAQAREDAAKANNVEVLEDANAKLAAIAADRDSLDGLLRSARDQVRRLASAEAGNRLGADVIAGIAARAAEVDRRLAEYDAACRRDAVRFQALQDQIRPQM